MKLIITLNLLIFSINSFAQKMDLINLEGETINVVLLDEDKTTQLIMNSMASKMNH